MTEHLPHKPFSTTMGSSDSEDDMSKDKANEKKLTKNEENLQEARNARTRDVNDERVSNLAAMSTQRLT
jgi:hypothetical protein